MSQKIFVNLPVKNLAASKEFFEKLGYNFNPQFSNEMGGCLVISEEIYAMLVTHDFFKTFTPKPISDASKSTEVLMSLSANSRKEVDEIVAKAVAAGGETVGEPKDHGFMYEHGFADLDGHIWTYFWMDAGHVQ